MLAALLPHEGQHNNSSNDSSDSATDHHDHTAHHIHNSSNDNNSTNNRASGTRNSSKQGGRKHPSTQRPDASPPRVHTAEPNEPSATSASSAAGGGSSAAENRRKGHAKPAPRVTRCDGYTLRVTGHSLGGGTAVLLTHMLRAQYPSAR